MSLISFVIPCYRSEHTIEAVVREIERTMNSQTRDTYEVILVNDGSLDGTFLKINELCEGNPNLIGLDMAKNFGQHAALMAGLRFSKGDYVVCLDDDGQTPAEEVYTLIDKLEEGYDVVYASYIHKKHSFFRNFGSVINSKMTEMLLNKPRDLYVSSYFIARRFIIEEVIRYENPYPYVMGLILRTTNNITCAQVHHREREEGQSGYTIRKLLGLWLNGFTAFSIKPLRMATYLGMFSATVGFFYAIWTLVKKIVNPAVPIGWTSIIIILLVLGGMILFVLGLIGEYVGRMYISMNNSPQYVVKTIIKNADSTSFGGNKAIELYHLK